MKLAVEEFERVGEADPLTLFNQGIKAEQTREKYTRMLRLVLCRLLEDILKGSFEERAGQLDEEFFAIDISHLGGPVITVNLLEADRSFGDQFSTKFSFDEMLAELADGKYDPNDKAMQEIRNLISVAYPEEYQDEAAYGAEKCRSR